MAMTARSCSTGHGSLFATFEPVTLGGTVADLVFDVPQGDGDNLTVLDETDTANQAAMVAAAQRGGHVLRRRRLTSIRPAA
jgi:hypothetical protein